jgi:hypothetical protein
MPRSKHRPDWKRNLRCPCVVCTTSSIARGAARGVLGGVSYVEAIQRWRGLPEAEQRRLRWAVIPQQVADSMAFEGEPVDLAWLTKLHHPTPPPAGWKPAAESSDTPS